MSCFLQIVLLCLLAIVNAKYYSLDAHFNVQEINEEIADILKFDDRILAVSQFVDDRNTTGWTYLTVTSNKKYADWAQAYGIGLLESFHTYELIYASFKNRMDGIEKKGFSGLPQNVSDFINNQTKWALETAFKNRGDPYWDLVNATIAQLTGMYDGYVIAVHQAGREDLLLTFEQFYLLTYEVDLYDVLSKFTDVDLHLPSCSFLLKLTDEGLYGSHTTWAGYNMLLRIYKIFNINFNNPLVHTKRISFTSQPGSLPSIDDYYIVDNNRVVTETTLLSENPEVYQFLHYDSLPYWLRVNVANLAFTDQKSWADLYYKYRSGTYNNQWLIIDFNNYNVAKNNLSQAQNIIWMVEEFYGLTSAQDVTQQLLIPQGYVASYNVPYNQTIQNLSQDTTSYTTDPRYTLFKKYAPGIKNFEDFKNVMRMNNISDTQDYCQAIASRCDLSPNQTEPWGAFDCKITSDKWVSDHQIWLISGPTTSENIPPFTWDDWPNYNILETPKVFNFDWVFVDPDRNFSASTSEILTLQKLLY